MKSTLKPVRWMGTTLFNVRSFPDDARHRTGQQLLRVQAGNMPKDWKPMPSIGPGVCELRIHTQLEHRLIYLARFEEAVYVLHAFEKRSQKTRPADIQRARAHLAQVLRERQLSG